jgi:exonuclease 3'-5' domain-containing protein 2
VGQDNHAPLPEWGNDAASGPIPDYPVLPVAWDNPPTENGNPQGASAADTTLQTEKENKIEAAAEITLDPPYPALNYKMSEELFRAAKRAPAGTLESYWSYALYRGLDDAGLPQKPKVHYCRSKHTAEHVCQKYFVHEKVLGFDLEWMADASRSAGPRKNVSLIQLASPSRIALFHVALFSKEHDFVAPSFKKIMETPEITKVGVWIKGDATRLRTHLGIDSCGLMELSHLYKLVTYSRSGEFKNINKRLVPLATQVEKYLHLPMFKGQDVRSGDWSRPLAMDQVTCKSTRLGFHCML